MASPSNPTLSLTEILQGERPLSTATTAEHRGDQALLAQNWSIAVAAYEECVDAGLRVDEKHGWCLVHSENWANAVTALTSHRDNLSSAGLAALAVASAGGWNARYRLDEKTQATVDEILAQALAHDAPDYLAYAAFFWFRSYREDASALLAHVRKSIFLYPGSPFLRLQMARCSWRWQGDEAEVFAILESGLNTKSTSEYLWEFAESSSRLERWTDALDLLDRALSITVAGGQASRQTALQIRLKKAEVLTRLERDQLAITLYQELAALDSTADRAIVLAARRALLATACRGGKADQASEALKSWLAVAIPSLNCCDFSELLNGEYGPIYFIDGGSSAFHPAESLMSYRDQLFDIAERKDRGLIRFLFAGYERESDDDYDKQAFAEAMLEAEQENKGLQELEWVIFA